MASKNRGGEERAADESRGFAVRKEEKSNGVCKPPLRSVTKGKRDPYQKTERGPPA